MHSLKLNLLILAVALGTVAHAEEEGGAKPAVEEDKNLKEFTTKSAKLTGLSSKIEETERHFDELVKEKEEAKSQADKQRLIKELADTDKERSKAHEDYDKLKAELAMRFPNQGVTSKRNYQTEGGKSKDEKGAATLDEQLTRTKKIIDKKFATFNDQKKNEPDSEKEIAKPEEEKRLRLEK